MDVKIFGFGRDVEKQLGEETESRSERQKSGMMSFVRESIEELNRFTGVIARVLPFPPMLCLEIAR